MRFAIPPLVAVSLGVLLVICAWNLLGSDHSTRPLPQAVFPLNSASRAPVSAQTCVACHEDHVKRFESAPHQNTLLPGNHPLVAQRLDGKSFTDEQTGAQFRFTKRDEYVWLESSRRSNPLRVDWLFGSGHHACTPVTVVENPSGGSSVLQHVMSWYPDNSIGWTLGQTAEQRDLPGIAAVALPHTAQESRSCFLCHTTWLPETDDQLNLHQAIPNVTCIRCHPQAEQHVAHPEHGSIQKWSELSPLESVNRCGECHRRADHFTPDELVTSNKLLIRFASASLVQSGCFKNQTPARRFDCMTCHDPHEPASGNSADYNRKCIACHSAPDDRHCQSEQTSDQCIGCHMVQEQVQESLIFTDHWIRVR